MNYTLYKHTTPSNKVYIGITSMKVKKRWCGGRGYRHNPHFYKAILKYGWGNIKHEILLTGLTKEKAEWGERDSLSPVWGRKHTPGEKNLISKSLRERRDYCGIRCIETLQVYSTIHEASIATGVSTSTIGRDCCGEKHIGKRLHFERYYGSES